MNVTVRAFALFVLLAPAFGQSGPEIDAGVPNGSDDTGTLQAIFDVGGVAVLRPGLIYRISHRLDLFKTGSGVVTYGAPATLLMLGTFNNTALRHLEHPGPPSNSIGLYANDLESLRLENFKLQKIHVDGSCVTGVWLRLVNGGLLKNLEVWGFSLGHIIELDSCQDVSIRGCILRDSWANTAAALGENRTPQLTGIVIDDNKVANGVNQGGSVDIVIANNTIRNLRFKDMLYNMDRSLFAPTLSGDVGFETDGINPAPFGDNIKILDNVLDVLGEGVDAMASNVTIEGNRVSNVYGFGIKLVHGANNAVVTQNSIHASGLGAMMVAGSSLTQVPDTCFNYFRQNVMTGFGRDAAFVAPTADAGFVVPSPASYWGSPAFPCAVWATANGPVFPRVNIFVDQTTTFIQGIDQIDKMFYIGAECRDVLFLSDAVNANLPTFIDPASVGCAIVPDDVPGGPLEAVRGDFDGNSGQDIFVLAAGSGQNILYRQVSNHEAPLISSPIATVWINESPDILRVGDFNGDGMDDLFWCWRRTGTNRVAYGTTTGFSSVYFDLIIRTAINEDPDHVVVGDFDGAIGDDLMFHWGASGVNRCAFSIGAGTFALVLDPIAPDTVTGSCDVRVFDSNIDGRKDVNFFWHGSEQRRLYLGQSNRTFVQD